MTEARRAYHSPVRASGAARTRAAIVDAAGALFERDGYARTPMQAIADEAGVSIQAVRLAGPKSALLLAAYERAFAGDEGRHALVERAEMVAILEEPSTELAIERYAEYITRANARTAGLWRAMAAAAHADPDVRSAVDDLDRRRRGDVAGGGAWLVSRGIIAAESATRATDLLGFVTHPDAYAYLVLDTGWDDVAYATWLRTSIAGLALSTP
ncbi:TetR/AcrR family transcriptional regulator [Agromyces atrinae]|uniref:AcrR family transcriptional regulator n=1 Tax=Agromyces atrinae TaxID=592376 RepID=A0A4Q2M2N5_9MICO|nr:helix-turn-helix domain-containing protein [Agromyces atrinae]NYD68656.1 AcrR family transcriptional regulator [Agromyces atrinae]RXZ86028.1 TetR/AcrR family transcriptional regulator [Agromyces atrinae]